MRSKIGLVLISIALGAFAYHVTRSGIVMTLAPHRMLLTVVGVIALVGSIYAYRPISTRKQLSGKQQLAFLFSATLTGALAGLSAISFGLYPLLSDDFWWLGVAFALLGTVAFHIGLLLALLSYWQQRRGVL